MVPANPSDIPEADQPITCDFVATLGDARRPPLPSVSEATVDPFTSIRTALPAANETDRCDHTFAGRACEVETAIHCHWTSRDMTLVPTSGLPSFRRIASMSAPATSFSA